ncbi:conserved hypothetical protein [Methanohalobium evestigatum Z-7303]|uniref:Squalene cyclase C-terminal domain-containing protein n=1 Tax=Methanohalobium evestigatum (strain ATCC BAA-1072 / DSM 3721 / NBRC 107634 / OCM 161 / Z-7303) TaxID=644295 RepID=D7E600_METEZ|nr:prenyltransferase/squalene oxidase repeat-containing protein [Methanohalobium evestigatum]ADI73022.1 conserved hypothetical protein [Methanohalobium evestigatum Z-7303]
MYFRPYIKKSLEWLKKQKIDNVKDLSRLTVACDLWGIENHYAAKLIHKKHNSSWNNSIRDTSRACSALANIGIIFPDAKEWLLNQKTDDSWNKDVYDTAYALIALSDMDVSENIGCDWLIENYDTNWEHVGTTSLVITALVKQEKLLSSNHYQNFIQNRAEWILSQSDKGGGWSYISTSNLAIQALMLAGYRNQLKPHIQWLLDNFNENGYWGYNNKKVIATAWSLMTLALYNSHEF